VSQNGVPLVSVIVATYNWSSVLRWALRSILEQSLQDFEVLVVGDACTDDSAAVVAALGDARLQWHNLPHNTGSQSMPNNLGLSQARGRYIAYLGHDDLWWPSHLASTVAVLERGEADMVAAGGLIYGPRESGIRSVTGFFPHGIYQRRYFFPPSSLVMRRALAERVGGWRTAAEARVAVDVDFLERCHGAGGRVASTGEITVFKFSAAWRRDAYRRRDDQEQRAFWNHMREQGEAFRLAEVTGAAQAAVLDRLHRIELPPECQDPAERGALTNRLFKGSVRPQAPAGPVSVEGRCRRYAPPQGYAGFEWHAVEHDARWGTFRWSGPSTRSCLAFPEQQAAALVCRLLVVSAIASEVLASARLSVNGSAVTTWCEPGPEGATLLCGRVSADPGASSSDEPLLLSLEVAQTWRPIDRSDSDDRRWLGLAIGWVEFVDA
jgi:hypothetical protein